MLIGAATGFVPFTCCLVGTLDAAPFFTSYHACEVKQDRKEHWDRPKFSGSTGRAFVYIYRTREQASLAAFIW